MKVLIVGGGGREHALAWKLSRDSARPDIFCAPGNAGTAPLGNNLPLAAEDLDGITSWAKRERPDLTVIGPEAPLCAGLTDRLQDEGLDVFGPNSAAARLEASKLFAKEIMIAAGVPTARAETFTDCEQALARLEEWDTPLVVKADGLAAGKGVTVCSSRSEAEQAIRECMEQERFGSAGRRILLEDCLAGQEASILALVDGESSLLLAASQDHKRVAEGDSGANTGGMGAYCPAPIVDSNLHEQVRATIIDPVAATLRRRGIDYRGVLYAGLMLTDDGPQVLEFNCRFGDPETQAILPLWKGDMLPALEACCHGRLRPAMVNWHSGSCVCVVMASGGYPGAYEKGKTVTGLREAGDRDGIEVFHAGTRQTADGRVLTDGGRVLGVTARAPDLRSARDRCYEAVDCISFEGAYFRRDIGWRAL